MEIKKENSGWKVSFTVTNTGESENFTDKFDNTQDYTGDLKFNLNTGDITGWCEKLESRWTIVDTSSASKRGTPDYIVMKASRKRCLEKVN